MRYVALLRGINVGKANRVTMAGLRKLLEELGFEGVETLLNSGNAVFESSKRSSAALGSEIESALRERLGVDVRVIVKSSREVASVVMDNPFVGDDVDPARLLVAFANDPKSLGPLESLQGLLVSGESMHIGKQAAYFHFRDGFGKSKAAAALLGRVGKAATTRNWATVLKIENLLS